MIELLAHRTNLSGNLTVLPLTDIVKTLELPDTHNNMFKGHKQLLQSIPEVERINIHYKLANKQGEQDLIPIDIDKITGMKDLYISDPQEFKKVAVKYRNVVANQLNLDAGKLGVVFSGNGLHILIQTDFIFHEKDISGMRDLLKDTITELNYAFAVENLSGYVDLLPFRSNGTLRFPGSVNKKGDSYITSELLQIPQPQNFEISQLRQEPELRKFIPDTEAVIKGCDFLNHCRVNARELPRNQWFLMIGLLRHLKNGDNLVHEYSSLDGARYKEAETQKNLDDWQDSGPPLCSTVKKTYSKCIQCPHFAKDTTALMLKNENSRIIEAKLHGFRELIKSNKGDRKGKFLYQELVDYFIQDRGTYIIIMETQDIYQYNGKHYDLINPQVIKTFAYENMDGASSKESEEFLKVAKMQSSRFVNYDTLNNAVTGKVNFNNGVFFSDNGAFVNHSPEFYFTTVLNSNYTKEATAPQFMKFMDEMLMGDRQIQDVLIEFFGMTLANAPSKKVCKALFLVAEANSGKSTFLDIMTAVLGKKNTSAVNVGSFNNDNHIANMIGKSANIVYEMGVNELRSSEKNFKAIVAGDSVFTRQLYQNGSDVQFNTKVIVACNQLPPVDDSSNGVFRRMLVVPLNNEFSDAKGNIDRDMGERIISNEIPGIINELLKGWIRFKNNRYKFSESKSMTKELNIVKGMNPIVNFCQDYLEMDKNNQSGVKAKLLYEHYTMYCRETGRSPKNKAQFLNDVAGQVASNLGVNKNLVEYKDIRKVVWLKHIALNNPNQDEDRF